MNDAKPREAATAILLGFVTVAIAFLLLQLLDFGYGRDQGIYATVARTFAEHGVPYRDAWDFKPPGIFLVYAVAHAVFGSGVAAIRCLEAIALCTLIPAAWILARRYVGDGRAGLLSAGLAIFIHVQSEFWDTAQPESFGAVCVIWALALASTALDERTSRRRATVMWFASGALYAAATMLKPTVGIAGLASVTVAVVKSRRRGFAAWTVHSFLPLALGAAAVTAVTLMPFLLRGGLNDLISAVIVFAPRYTLVTAQAIVPAIGRVLVEWAVWYSPLNLVGLLLLALPPLSASEKEGIAHLGSAVVLLLAGVAIQQKFFLYHYGAALPLTAVLAGWGIWKAWRRAGERWYALPLTVAALIALAAARQRLVPTADPFFTRCNLRLVAWRHPELRDATRDRLYSLYDYVARDNRLAADWIRRETPEGSRIHVWGFTPELYVASGRAAASRYIYDVPQRAPWSAEAARQELMADLRRTLPRVIVIEHGDSVPQVTGTQSDSAGELQTFPELRSLIAGRYELAFQVPKFNAYLRDR
jgi:Dolichyl-phosphate-mannose-protein mannosyltransferase